MNKNLIVFVHGLGGTPKGTWGSFESLLTNDEDLKDYAVSYFSYPTFIVRLPFLKRYPGVQTLSEALRTQIENCFSSFKEITLVCHSLGGLIGKQYLIDSVHRGLNDFHQLRVKRALFYAVPNNGAGLASVAEQLSWRHTQLRQLCRDSDLVRHQCQAWERNKLDSLIDVRYVVAGLDRVIDEHSARHTWANNNVEVIADKGHIDIVKPKSINDLSYIILKNHILRDDVEKKRSLGVPSTKKHPCQIKSFMQQEEKSNHCDLRIAISAILRFEHNNHFLFVRNLHRPESFAPFGGVYKFYAQAEEYLDKIGFRKQEIDADMKNDIRGFIEYDPECPDTFIAFKAWLNHGSNAETAIECLQRELREELMEIGLDQEIITSNLKFRHLRSVHEGPEYILSEGYYQFRLFDVYDLIINESPEVQAFFLTLIEYSKTSPNLLWATFDEIKRGRASGNQSLIAPHSAYLFSHRRYRQGEPVFANK